jgi:hypothetical protein
MSNKNTTRNLSVSKKEEVYQRNETLLKIIYYIGNGFMLKDQIVKIMGVLMPHKKNVMNNIEELRELGFLKQQQILNSNKFSVYLTKYPQSKIEGKKSGDVTSFKPSQEKIMNSLLKTEFYITYKLNLLTNCKIDRHTKVLLNNFMCTLSPKYQACLNYDSFFNKMVRMGLNPHLTKDYYDDAMVAAHDSVAFKNKLLKEPIQLDENCRNAKIELERRKTQLIDGRVVTLEKNFFNFNNMLSRNFTFDEVELKDKNELHFNVIFLDIDNNVTAEKLYRNVAYVYKMLKRYFSPAIYIFLNVECEMWTTGRCNELIDKSQAKIKDFGENNFKKYRRKENEYHLADVLEEEFKNIKVTFKSLDFKNKYQIGN